MVVALSLRSDESGGAGGGGEGGEGGEGGVGEGGGGGEGGEGGGGGDGGVLAQTSVLSNPQPVPTVQPSSSSATVQSLASAVWQMVSASAKVLPALHSHEPASDSPHTEQPSFLEAIQFGGLVSEQHRTWSRAAGHAQHRHKRAMGCVASAPHTARSVYS